MNQKLKCIIAFLASCLLMFGGSFYIYAAGTLSVAVSSDTVKTGDTVTVTVYAANANQEKVTADMSITYDTSLLEYISSSDTNATYGSGKVSAKGESVSIKFKAIASGDAYVKAEGATLTAGGTHITVTGAAASDASDNSGSTVKSGDNSLSSLTISPGTLSPAFKGSVTEYTAEVGSDVNEISVNPVTSNSKATVESISGNKDLQSGKNVITVLVKAENGTEASYRITVTKGEGGASSAQEADTPASSSDTPQTDGASPETDTPAQSDSADAIVIDGVTYKISEEFTDEEIPEDFSRADFEYKGKPYKGISYDHGHLGMYYLSNEAGESKFFIYDADRDKFYPYVRLSSGNHYIILMVVPNGAIPPQNYQEARVTIGEGVTVSAYQFTGPADKEIVKFDNPEEEAAYNAESDFYLFYGMDDTGVSGWYQYDAKQGTYQRFNQDAIIPEDNGQNYDALLASYNDLSERYDNVRSRDRKLIGGLIFSAVVLLILIINLLLKVRELKLEADSAFYDEDDKGKKIQKKQKREAKAPAKEFPEPDSRQDRVDFYDADDKDIIDEFEEDPDILSSRRKREKEARMQRQEHGSTASARKRTQAPDDDDIEFLDLN